MTSASEKGPLVVVGGGRMGEALASGLLAQAWPRDDLVIVESSPLRRDQLDAGSLPVTASLEEALARVDRGGGRRPVGAVIAVKPYDVETVSRQLAGAGVARALSIAAGVTLDDLDSWLDPVVALRAMPNTPALVGAAASAVAPGGRAGPADIDWAQSVLSAVGTVVEL